MSAGRVLLGIILCLAVATLIVSIVTIIYSLTQIPGLSDKQVYQLIFFLLMEPYFAISLGYWSVLAGLAVGAFIGGLASKGAGNGFLVGLINWIIIFILYISVTFVFNFADLSAWWATRGIILIVYDMIIGLVVLLVVGAIGGAITTSGEK